MGETELGPTSRLSVRSLLDPLLSIAAMATAGENTWPEREPAKAPWSNSKGHRGYFRDSQGAIREERARSEPVSPNSLEVFDPEFKPQRLKTQFFKNQHNCFYKG